MPRVVATAIGGATLGATLGFAAGFFFHRPFAKEIPTVDGSRTELVAISQQLQSMNMSLESMRQRIPSSAIRQPESPPSNEEPAVTNDIRELRRVLEEFRIRISSMEPTSVSNQSLVHVAKNVSRLREVWDGLGNQGDAANANHFLWTPIDVYREYGMPDLTRSIQGDTAWQYWICDHDEWAQYLVFHFTGGYFVCTSTEQRRKTDK
jgi:hypothetical protein